MNKREALKLKKGDKFRMKPMKGILTSIRTVENVELTVNYDYTVNEVFITDTEGNTFLHTDICFPDYSKGW